MNTARYTAKAALLPNGKVLIVGGYQGYQPLFQQHGTVRPG